MTTYDRSLVTQVNTEEPSKHWGFIRCKDEIVLDLGCGRWEHVEYRDQSWPTTPEYLIQLGASKVYAIDIDSTEVLWYLTNITPKLPVYPQSKAIHSANDVRELLLAYKPTVIKCDIEGAETTLLSLTDDEFRSIRFYAIEAHSENIFNGFMEKFNQLNYKIVSIVELTHAHPMKVIFAERNDSNA